MAARNHRPRLRDEDLARDPTRWCERADLPRLVWLGIPVALLVAPFAVFAVEPVHFESLMRVRIRLASYPGKTFTGKISRLSPIIDPHKRTLRLWAEVPNRKGKLKPNLFAEMDVVVGGGRAPADPDQHL